MGRLLYLKDVVSLSHRPERCNGCGSCLEVCPRGVWEWAQEGEKVRIAERDACIECGACRTNCATAAIEVTSGVGCAAAVLNAALGRSSSACCCSIDDGPGCC